MKRFLVAARRSIRRSLRNKVYRVILLWAVAVIGGEIVAETVLVRSAAAVSRENMEALLTIVNVVVIAGGAALTVALYFFLRRQILIPIEELRAVTGRFNAGDRQARCRVFDERDELGKLATAFNALLELVADQEELRAEQMSEIKAKNEELARSTHLKSKFLSMISHELRSPLNSIMGYAELLLDEVDGRLNPEQREDILAIRRSSEHLRRLIDDILDLSKLEAGRMRVELRAVSLNEVVKESEAVIQPMVAQKGLLFATVSESGEILVRADRHRLRQVIINLLTNAAKFTEKGGITVKMWCEGSDGLFEVKDTGVGVPADQIERIFEDFHQVDAEVTRRHGGTGLGLPIVRHLLHLMNGEVTVTSAPGEGTTFTVRLPLAREELPEIEEAVPAILVVDGDQQAISLYGRHLARERIGVIAAKGANDACEKLEMMARGGHSLVRLAAVVLDLDFLGAEGYKLLERIRRDERWKDTAVGCITSRDEDTSDFDATLAKPVSRKGLTLLVRSLLRRR